MNDDGSAGCFVVPEHRLVTKVRQDGQLHATIERTPWLIPQGAEVWCCRGCRLLGSSHDMLWHRCSEVKNAVGR